MANEFVARKGLISSGSINVSGSVTASYFKGDGSQLINLPASTVLSSSVSIDTHTFTGDGLTVNYVLSQSYNVNSLLVSVDGLSQTNITDFTLSGSTITFVDTPPSSSNILVKAFVNVTQNMTGSFSGSFFGIISTASFAQTASYALNAGAGAGFPFSGSAVITGSLEMVDAANRGGITGSVSGALTGTFPYSSLTSIPSGIVSGATQVATLLPNGTISSSNQVDYNSITNKLSDVVSSSAQVQPLLPGGTVSSSAQYPGWVTASSQIDITATTNYSTFSSSLATVDAEQTLRIDNLASLTSSYAINSTIQNQLAGVVSSSTQVQPLLPGGTVSASNQVDITATTGYSTFSSSLATVDAGQTTRIDDLASLTSSYAINSTIQGQLANVVSSSTQVQPLLPDGTVSSSAQYPGWVTASSQIDYNSITNKLSGVVSSSAQVQPLLPGGTVSSSTQTVANLPTGTVSSSGQVVVQNTTGIGALATTGSNVFTANQTITGSLFISQNLVVQGSSSISYISQSTLNIGTNKITVNTDSPSVRFGGLDVIDSGSSPQRSGSLYFDSLNDQWIFVHQNTAGGTTSSVVVMGPPTFNNIGNETLLTQDRVLKGGGLEHIVDSQITDNGVTVSITNGLSVGTNLTASQADITTLRATAITSSVSGALTGTFPYIGLTGLPTLVSASSQIDYNNIQNKLSGVISSSTQFNALTNTSASYALTASFALNATGGGALSSSVVVDNYNFIGNGVKTIYQVSKSYSDSSVFVTVGGVAFIVPDDYSISASYIVFTEAPASSSNISVKALMNVAQSATGSFSGSFTGDGNGLFNISAPVQVDTYTFDANGSTSVFNLGKTYSSNALIVSVDGLVYTNPTDYSFAGTAVTFVDTPVSESTIQVKAFVNTSNATGSYSGSFIGDGSGLQNLPLATTRDTYQYTGNGVTTNYTLNRLYSVTSLDVSVAGLQYAPITDYTLSGFTLSFLSPPPSGSNIYINALINTTSNATGSFSGSFTGNFNIFTSSVTFAETATSASFATTASAATSLTFVPVTSSFATTASFATSASFATTASAATSLTFVPTTASFANTASAATSITFVPVTSSFANTASAATSITFTPTTASFATTTNNLNGGAANYIPLWSSNTAQSASSIYQLTGNVGINNIVPSASLHVSGTTMVDQIIEKVNITGSAPPSTFNLDLTSGSIFFRSASTSATWTLNFRGNLTTPLNSMMYNGQSITATVLVYNGATAYSASAYQVDGVSITPRWQGGTSGSGNTNSLDAHQFTIIKLASASYVVLGSITKYT